MGEGAIGIGTAKGTLRSQSSKAWRFIEFKNVRFFKCSERQIGREKGECPNAEEEPLISGPGWLDNLVVDTERRKSLFIVQKRFNHSTPRKKFDMNWN